VIHDCASPSPLQIKGLAARTLRPGWELGCGQIDGTISKTPFGVKQKNLLKNAIKTMS
jgi:hypothetical protein